MLAATVTLTWPDVLIVIAIAIVVALLARKI